MSAATVESALQFGDTGGLLGVVTSPTVRVPGRPAVVFLNAGLIHRVGPFRMSVELARRFAAAGFLACRFDQTGLGDSLPRADGVSYEERSVLDVRQALDALGEQFGVRRFVLVGLCAGAMSAHRAAVADKRVVGACLLDGYAYKTPKAHLQARLAQAADPAFWREAGRRALSRLERAWGGRVGAAVKRGSESEPSAALRAEEAEEVEEAEEGESSDRSFARSWPPRDVVGEELRQLVARGVRTLFIYTGGWSDYVHRDQFSEMFPGLGARDEVEVEFFPDADHTYLIVAQRERMALRIEQFLAKLA